jgi:hypothetical protein
MDCLALATVPLLLADDLALLLRGLLLLFALERPLLLRPLA